MGERTLRRLLIIAASSVVHWAKRKGVPAGSFRRLDGRSTLGWG